MDFYAENCNRSYENSTNTFSLLWSLIFSFSVPPQGAEIQGPLQPFTCSRGYFISCKVWGSNPAARIEWFRGTSPNHGLRPLKAHNQTVTEGGNVTISWLHYLPKPSHHHQTLICRGSNDELMTANSHTVEDYHRLEIFCEYRGHSKATISESLDLNLSEFCPLVLSHF